MAVALLRNRFKLRKQELRMLTSTHSTKVSRRHERCIVTCERGVCIFFFLVPWFWTFLIFPPHFSKVCLCHTGDPPMSAFVGLQWAHGKTDPQCAGKEKLFVPGTLFILRLCGNIADFARLSCVFPIFATSATFCTSSPLNSDHRSCCAESGINPLNHNMFNFVSVSYFVALVVPWAVNQWGDQCCDWMSVCVCVTWRVCVCVSTYLLCCVPTAGSVSHVERGDGENRHPTYQGSREPHQGSGNAH